MKKISFELVKFMSHQYIWSFDIMNEDNQSISAYDFNYITKDGVTHNLYPFLTSGIDCDRLIYILNLNRKYHKNLSLKSSNEELFACQKPFVSNIPVKKMIGQVRNYKQNIFTFEEVYNCLKED